jgi:hypothetical protein
MNSLSQNQLKTLIQLESEGKITPKEIYKRCALAKVQQQDNYVSTAVVHVIVGVALVGLAGELIIPVVIASWLYTWAKAYRSRQDAIRRINGGHIADYLDPDDRVSYEEDMKAETVEAVVIPTNAAKADPAGQMRTSQAVLDSAIADFHQPDATANTMPPIAKPTLQVVDLPRALGQSLHPTIISAKPRIGKGMVIQAAWRHAKRAHSGLTVWVLDPKPHPTERGYWHGVDRYWGRMVEDFPQNDEALTTELTAFIHEWRAQGNRPTLLIVDELVKLEAVLPKWYRDFLLPTLKVEASSGETDRRFLWAIAQSPQVKDLGLTGGSRAVFDFLTLQRADSIDHAERVKASISAIKTIPTVDEFVSVPSGVAFWHSRVNRWGGVPLLQVPQPAKVAIPTQAAMLEQLQRHADEAAPMFEDEDPAFDLISDIDDRDKREALMIAYQWATKRKAEGKEITRDAFLQRARNERRSIYLKDSKDEIWEELSALIF